MRAFIIPRQHRRTIEPPCSSEPASLMARDAGSLFHALSSLVTRLR